MSDILGERERDLAELESMLDEAENLKQEELPDEAPMTQQGKVKQPLRLDEEPGDGPLREEINACCNGLGKLDINDGVYMKDRDCKIFLREIVRFLSADKKRHQVRMQLNELNIIDSDLIPLMVQYCDFNDGDPELFNLIIRICTTLTIPTFILFDEKVPGADDPMNRMLYDKIHQQIGKYKESFASNEYVWQTLNTHLRHTNSKEDLNNANLHFERLIILIRNILHIPTKSGENPWDSANNVHENLLGNMEKSGLLSTLLAILCDSTKGSEYCFHLMEIIYYMLRDQNPKTIALAERPEKARTGPKLDPERQRYLEIRERNRLEREASKHVARFSRFKQSTFVVNNVRGIGNRPLVLSRPEVNETRIIDDTKTLVKKNKNRKPLDHKTSMEISDQKRVGSQVSYNLKVFCRKFVQQVYNTTMLQMKHNLIQKRAQEDDESTYLWAIQFFTSFSRCLKLPVELIAESLAVSTFHMINMLITGYQEKIKMEKKNFHTLTSRLHLALRAYRETLLLIEHVLRYDPSYKAKADSLMAKLFNEKDYANLLLSLFKQYSEPKHTLHYARDLIETNDVFIRLFEEYSKTSASTLNANLGDEDDNGDADDSDSDDSDNESEQQKHQQIPDLEEPDLDEILVDPEPRSPNSKEPADEFVTAASEASPQPGRDRDNAANEPGESLGAASAKSLTDANSPNEELMNNPSGSPAQQPQPPPTNEADEPEPKSSNEESSDDDGNPALKDRKKVKNGKMGKKRSSARKGRRASKRDELVKFGHFLSYYAHPDIITIYMSILLQYKLNDDSMNGLILRFFEKLAHDCKCQLMLCQASVFKLLFAISEDASRPAAGRQQWRCLCKHLCEFYGDLFNKRRWLIQELMYWKTQSDCISIENAIDPPPEPEVVIAREDLDGPALEDIFGGGGDSPAREDRDDGRPASNDAAPAEANDERLMEIPLSQLLSSSEDEDADFDRALANFSANSTGDGEPRKSPISEREHLTTNGRGGDGGDDDVNTSDNHAIAHKEASVTAAAIAATSGVSTEAANDNAREPLSLDEDSDL